MKWLKNVIKGALREFLKETDLDLARRSTEHIVLAKDYPNILTIDCGQMPSGKAYEYLEKVVKVLRQQNPGYNISVLSKRG